ncbi:ribosomal subunit interface protein [Candidatus Falkowbacteria bacterium CG_4_10_14_0_2_um_filter_41_15]|uniref:Ribosomal subunit interface protein n=2 Tax=Candidatus Falkowiibacteriota TaxID=1752728 RepID=A0A2G9ZNG4_9BACT|nr:MAG: ribosomal subunit interface protein [Candidatus Falkowbacteria bacterium CG23_combo_of_CG06-09_8_20_14_all_41_10]PJA09310.1 MAG: ribosomal subunit interface protein [Candidatus Falkowbacteria bacterium CG_4_10_14_0_2_um_filter_41_15]
MQVRIKASKIKLTDAIANYINEKLEMVEKYLNHVKVLNCDFEIEKSIGSQHKGDIFRAEINLQVPGEILRVEKTESDLYKAIDKVKDHLTEVVKKYKEKKIEKRRV